MHMLPNVFQSPAPGTSRVLFCGDCLLFTLTLDKKAAGNAWVRTNLGTAAIARQEIIDRVEKNEIKLDEAWYDIQMKKKSATEFQILLPLHQTGYFQAKCFFIPENQSVPVWPEGDNCILNVEPAGTCCANIIYNAFVRQFGPSRSSAGSGEDRSLAPLVQTLDTKGFTVIPESGKFRDLKEHVGFIFSTLGCRALHLLPIHPTPTTYARMGRFGSPYAALNFTDVDPALARFDPAATPLEQFMELVDAVHFHNGYLFLDIAINHTGWAAAIHQSHPEWLVRGEDGRIKAPGAWGVVWADLTKLDYTHTDLWEYMADIFLLWCHRGVDGFRCDAGYMVPTDAWEYMVARVRQEYPDTLFLLEGLGGYLSTTREILSRADFNWAYSELFQHYTREEIQEYLPFATRISETCGHMIHFAETHDNNRLAAVSPTYARMRTAMCALFSVCGGFGFANGVEWFATQKINVHESPGLNWGAKDNQVEHIFRLNQILKTHPAFFKDTRLAMIHAEDTQALALLRHNQTLQKHLLVLVNLDCQSSTMVSWNQEDAGPICDEWTDLLTGTRIRPTCTGNMAGTRLAPGEVMALSPDPSDLKALAPAAPRDIQVPAVVPEKVLAQKIRARVLAVKTALDGYRDVSAMELDQAARDMSADPGNFIRSLNTKSQESCVIPFDVTKDLRRQVMVPPGYFLLVKSPVGFRAEILDTADAGTRSLGYEEGLPLADGCFFALFLPMAVKKKHKACDLHLRLFYAGETRKEKAAVLFLAPFDTLRLRTTFTRRSIAADPGLTLLGTTSTGGMMRAPGDWGELHSRYDGLLGANLHPGMPENRRMVLARCRIWAIFQGYSRKLAKDCLQSFVFSFDNAGQWRFHVPTSEGKYYVLELTLTLASASNRIHLSVRRLPAKNNSGRFLEDTAPVTLIFRPDIEDRDFHETVKAFTGPETAWPAAVKPRGEGFDFSLSSGHLFSMGLADGVFVHAPEWQYMVHRPLEAQRGLDPDSDLFSPGYFTFDCRGGESASVVAEVRDAMDQPRPRDMRDPLPEAVPAFGDGFALDLALFQGLDAFLVNRGQDRSVIAGYPWFLDWGRDSLIFCRGLIELGRISDARAVLHLFGRFEDQGTLPNMICGEDAGNIETSDAPLWFFACCRDMMEKTQDLSFLDQDLDGRTLKQVLVSMAESLVAGTRTGVRADPDTQLLYSPAHFTWMDTNFPAGSPRRGYPVEIQALWYNALVFLGTIEPGTGWNKKAHTVKQAITSLFWQEPLGYFSDCLHGDGPASRAVPDDALRPNQLLLLTLGAIDPGDLAQKTVETCLELLVPGGIRSLADRKVSHPLAVVHDGITLNDPHHPYAGVYQGDEDTQRKPAYHNGTAWTWQFPVFCEAWAAVFGPDSHATCLAWLGSCKHLMRTGAAGYIPEILDGDFPHTPRGCDAQAWGVSEAARVVHKLSSRST
jgi:predicted glycogen debranching enzyme